MGKLLRLLPASAPVLLWSLQSCRLAAAGQAYQSDEDLGYILPCPSTQLLQGAGIVLLSTNTFQCRAQAPAGDLEGLYMVTHAVQPVQALA
jgi:hypothetical protein